MSKNLSRIVAVLFIAFASAGPTTYRLHAQGPHQAAKLRQTVDKECEEFLQKMLLEEHFTGVALVKKADKVLHAKGYGEATEGRQNSLDTVFHVASITKQFTAAATLQLVEAGKIHLETPINEYLPKKYRSNHWKNVTCSHLLSHSSGIEDYALVRDYYNVVDGFCLGDTVDGMIREAMQKPLRFEPGSKFEYSNIGFILLGEIIENQTSMEFDEYVKSRILKPLGMTSSRVHVIGHVPTANEASGYRWNAERKRHMKDKVVTLPVTAPDGGLTTTLSDFIKWIGVFSDTNPRVVSKDSVRNMMTQKVSLDPKDVQPGERGYGYGLFVGDGLLSHPGYIVGFRSHFILDPEKELLVVVFSNNTTNNPKRIARGLFKIANARFDDGTPNALKNLEWFIGEWEHANADSYNEVSDLKVSWGKDRKSIDVTYSYEHYPGFCESAGFKCKETITTNKDGELTVEFHCKLTYSDALVPLVDATGSYELKSAEKDRWKSDGTLRGGRFTEKQKIDLTLHKISDHEVHIRTTNTALSSKGYKFEFRRKQK